MKRILVLMAVILALVTQASAQVVPIYFYGDSVIKNKDKATSYAIYGKLSTEELWTFKRYDLWDNLLQTGSYLDERLTTPHGEFTFYSDLAEFNDIHLTNFKLKGKTRFLSQTGSFVNGVENGQWLVFYPDGTVLNTQVYLNGKLHGEFITYDKFGDIEIKGNYVNGERDGTWIFEGGEKEIVYEKGIMKSSTIIDKIRKKKKTN